MSRCFLRPLIHVLPSAAFTLAVALAVTSGCVQRRMTVRTNVPGAQVYVDNYEIGRTPVSTDFVYYGDRTIKLVKDGYETQTVVQPVNAPWYQLPGIDFITENLWPYEIRDERNFNYQMQPQYVVPTDTLLSREDLRRNNTNAMQLAAPPATAPAISAPGMIAPPSFLSPAPSQPAASPYATPQPSLPGYPGSPVRLLRRQREARALNAPASLLFGDQFGVVDPYAAARRVIQPACVFRAAGRRRRIRACRSDDATSRQ
ncbi:MAG: PEGA domain-containing protein [Pirellulales bacterium]